MPTGPTGAFSSGRSDFAGQRYFVFEVKSGFCSIAWSDEGITGFRLPADSHEAAEAAIRRGLRDASPGIPAAEVAEAIDAAKRYFEGEKIDFSRFKLDLRHEDAFYARIYEAVRRLGWGETTQYGMVAKALGAGPEAARDVGQAMAGNPVALIIPCHRVLAAGGKVGGFSAPGGSTSKMRMLALEGVEMEPPKPAPPQMSFGF